MVRLIRQPEVPAPAIRHRLRPIRMNRRRYALSAGVFRLFSSKYRPHNGTEKSNRVEELVNEQEMLQLRLHPNVSLISPAHEKTAAVVRMSPKSPAELFQIQIQVLLHIDFDRVAVQHGQNTLHGRRIVSDHNGAQNQCGVQTRQH